MNRAATACLMALCLALLSEGWIGAEDAGSGKDPGLSAFDFRYGILAGTDLAALERRGAIIGSSNDLVRDPESGERRLAGYGEFHTVYEVPVDYFMRVLLDFSGYSRFMPWIISGSLLEKERNYYLAEFKVGISFLGMEIGFESVSESVVDSLINGSFGLRSRLVHSPSNNLYEHYVSWFIAPVVINDRPMTYVRYYNRPGVRKPFLGMPTLARTFGDNNMRGQVDGIGREAIRLWRLSQD